MYEASALDRNRVETLYLILVERKSLLEGRKTRSAEENRGNITEEGTDKGGVKEKKRSRCTLPLLTRPKGGL